MEFVVAQTSEINPGEKKIVFAGDKAVIIFNIDGRFYALDNYCPHLGGSMGDGNFSDGVIECPLHGWQFDVKSGECENMQAAKAKTYPVKIVGSDIIVVIN